MSEVLPLYPFAPWPWYRLLAHHTAVIHLGENYPKQTYRNRYEILTSNGSLRLTIPVEGQQGKKIAVRDIRLWGSSWKKNHWSAIRSGYGRAPYFEHVADDLDRLFTTSHTFLADFGLETIRLVIPWCKVPMPEIIRDLAPGIRHEDLSEHVKSNGPAIPYPQVFSDRFPFIQDLSILDALLNLGTALPSYLQQPVVQEAIQAKNGD